MRALMLVFVVLCVGCQYGPENIPHLYNLRAIHVRNVRNVEAIIFRIEREHDLESRGSDLRTGDSDRALREKIQALRDKIQTLHQAFASQQDSLALLEEEWFKELDPTMQLKWRMHRDQIHLSAQREVKVYQDLSPDGDKP